MAGQHPAFLIRHVSTTASISLQQQPETGHISSFLVCNKAINKSPAPLISKPARSKEGRTLDQNVGYS